MLLACLGALVTWGLLARWSPFVRYVGYAFTAGVFFSFLSIATYLLTTVRKSTVRTEATNISSRPIAFLSLDEWQTDSSGFRQKIDGQVSPLYPSSSIVSSALDDLLHLAIRDFILVWYKNISRNEKFAGELEYSIRYAIKRFGERLSQQDLADLLVSRILPLVATHLKAFDQAERLVRGKNLSRNVTESEELDIAISSRYRDGKLHPAASTALPDRNYAQENHLRKIIATVLPKLLPPIVVKSRSTSVLIRELLVSGLLVPLITTFADPDTWNQFLEASGRTALRDRKTVRELRRTLDQHAMPLRTPKQDYTFPKLRPNDSERDFERFIRSARRCNNLSDARRFRSNVTSQIKRESILEGQDPLYLRRLETAKRLLDQKLEKLSSLNGVSVSPTASTTIIRHSATPQPQEASLIDIMRNSTGLSYFMEFMDRLNLMSLVQFWIVVDGFRNPLEDDGDDTAVVTWNSANRNDMILLSENHLSKPVLNFPEESLEVVKSFIMAGKRATREQYRKARTVIFTKQSAVLDEMQNKYFPAFKKTDLYYKYLASDETTVLGPAHMVNAPVPNNDSLFETHEHHRPPFFSIDRLPSPSSQVSNRAQPEGIFVSDTPHVTALDRPQLAKLSSGLAQTPLFTNDIEQENFYFPAYITGKGSSDCETEAQNNHIIEDIESALNDILANATNESAAEVLNDTSEALHDGVSLAEKEKPSISSLGLVNTSSRIGVFEDDDLFVDDQKQFIEDEYADPEAPENDSSRERIYEPVPGDLGLTETISILTADIEKLLVQETLIDSLTRKAELTNNMAELRILRISKSSLRREVHRKELQKQQYILQENDSTLYGRSTVQIPSIMVDKEADGREYALYLIEVKRNAGEHMPLTSWAVSRRYSEFHELHQRLRATYPSVRILEFPRRRMVMKLHKDFLHKRRIALEVYLRQLLLLPEVCSGRELRAFLSQRTIVPPKENTSEDTHKDIVSRIYQSVAGGMDDFLGNITFLDHLSTAGPNLVPAATNQMSASQYDMGNEDPITAVTANAELQDYEDRELEPFIKPICDVFLEIFGLNRESNWVRGRATVVVLHQLLGGTIERKVRESINSIWQDSSLLRILSLVKDSLWPEGKLRMRKIRTSSEKIKSRTEASVMLATLVPELAGNVVGRANAQAAARRIFATINNQPLNLHLVYTILDEIILVLFEE
ncbi:Intermediate filament protein [Myotisia sp. PD_48]|nr:Intermediate filament protein [Myotisia sp. PD_48]